MGLLTKLPRWATGVTAGILEPLETKKDVGWLASEKPPAQYFNWLLKTIYDACVVLDGLENTARNWAAVHTFNAAVTLAQKLTANGGQDVKGNIALIDTFAQTLLKTAAGGLKIGTAAAGGDFELQAAGVTLLKLLASGSMDAQATALNMGSPQTGWSFDALTWGRNVFGVVYLMLNMKAIAPTSDLAWTPSAGQWPSTVFYFPMVDDLGATKRAYIDAGTGLHIPGYATGRSYSGVVAYKGN